MYIWFAPGFEEFYGWNFFEEAHFSSLISQKWGEIFELVNKAKEHEDEVYHLNLGKGPSNNKFYLEIFRIDSDPDPDFMQMVGIIPYNEIDISIFMEPIQCDFIDDTVSNFFIGRIYPETDHYGIRIIGSKYSRKIGKELLKIPDI